MSNEWMPSERVTGRARLHAALSDPQRLAMVEELLLGDRSPTWFTRQWGLPSNLLAHHVNVLVVAGLVARERSEADRRRVYLHLTEVGRGAADRNPVQARKVVFICTHNSARSQFAEAQWRVRSEIPGESGGTRPADRVHPGALRVARGHGFDLGDAKPKLVGADELAGALVVTVCDNADEQTAVPHVHWSVPDPVPRGGASDFSAAWDDIAERIDNLASTLEPMGAP
jgi:ArsR family transcriptional regulator, arsenate/arsenite/antimonite-responsive transcriptional repressor / arsenate reductase (thioredoxin)